MADWADSEAKEFNRYFTISSGHERLELMAAKFRELESRGASRAASSLSRVCDAALAIAKASAQ